MAGEHTVTGTYGTLTSTAILSVAPTRFAVTDTFGVGSNPIGVAIDPATHTAYAAVYSDDSVSVIDEATNTVTATVAVGSNPIGIAIDPATHTAYVTNDLGHRVSHRRGPNTVTATIAVGIRPVRRGG